MNVHIVRYIGMCSVSKCKLFFYEPWKLVEMWGSLFIFLLKTIKSPSWSHWKLTCSCHNIAELALNNNHSLTQLNLILVFSSCNIHFLNNWINVYFKIQLSYLISFFVILGLSFVIINPTLLTSTKSRVCCVFFRQEGPMVSHKQASRFRIQIFLSLVSVPSDSRTLFPWCNSIIGSVISPCMILLNSCNKVNFN